ncbi:F-box protein [Raphanus sativus]|uniref:F-box protein At4g00755-like n=1 Tax=Raphanus sativus TaxID=3726 RepID=A0A6J0M5U1_RAPSA|nr:F-box protein At4g00755-like [Raphanus sativus]KAJ4905580.1 F-box protein [Raphanus sativus]
MDFLNKLDTDTSLSIFCRLNDPSDVVRASAVSRSWRDLVIRYGLSKNLCFKLFHQLTCVDRVNDESSGWSKLLEREHRAFALLAKGCTSSPITSCIADAIVASSTDNFPEECILNTLDERDRIGATPSYWSSSGQHKTSVPETLVYKLKGDLCVVTEFSIHPFQAYFQSGSPIYSSHYVRFRLGHLDNKSQEKNNYVWTYTSQQFAMAQENRLQNFKLPEPVVCIGGYMLIEFLGRVQTQELDGLYYICVSHVKVMGRSLAKSFRLVDANDKSGKVGLKVVSYCDPREMGEEEVGQRPFRQMVRNHLDKLLYFRRR